MTPENLPEYRPVYRAIHRPLTVAGVDRRLFFMALLVVASSFTLVFCFLAARVLFSLLSAPAWCSTTHDPQMLQILLRSGASRRRYDPAKYTADAAPDTHGRA
jgi:type IV secretory pathway VirB3-like protein